MTHRPIPYKVEDKYTQRVFINCPRCNSLNTYKFVIEDHDNPESGDIICNDCGYNT